MLLLSVLVLVLLCSAVPAALFCANLRLYREPPALPQEAPRVAVLIPARNEEANIAACVRSVLASRGAQIDVLVMDDGSADRTAEIVQALALTDTRVQLLHAAPLPPGWNGKQHACSQLAHAAAQRTEAPLLLFLDADVRLMPDAVGRMAALQQASGAALVSGFPRQITITFLEWLLLPLIHFVLLGFLPIRQMRKSTLPGFAAGCGQFLMVEREAYFASGGHAGIRETMHDGLRLPRLFREHGYRTDLADLTHLAEVRMYSSASTVWSGLAKNATEGLAEPKRIVPLTALLLLGQVAPAAYFLCVLLAATFFDSWLGLLGMDAHTTPATLALRQGGIAFLALCASYLPRLLAVKRFRQPLKSALLHPPGMIVLLALQWYALARKLLGQPVGWRARTYASDGGAELQ